MGCGSCGDIFEADQKSVRCYACWLWYHLMCTNLKKTPDPNHTWKCPKCEKSSAEADKQLDTLRIMIANQGQIIQNLVTEKEHQSKLLKELIDMKKDSNNASCVDSNATWSPLNSSSATEKFLRRQTLQCLPKFSGRNPAEWPRFKAIFESTTKEGEFDDVDNASRLLQALEKPALEHVEIKLINPGNVPEVIKWLDMRYGNTDRIYEQLIDEVMSIKSLRDGKRESLIEFSTKLSNLVCTIDIMKMNERLKDPRLIRDLLGKLSLSYQEKWLDYSQTKDATSIKTFDDFIQARVKLLLQLNFVESRVINNSRGHVHVQSELPKNDDSSHCNFCDSDHHKIDDCDEFKRLTVTDRWEKAKQLRLCFGCLGKADHRVNQCIASKICNINNCSRPHHRLLHQRSQITRDTASSGNQPSNSSPAAQSKFIGSVFDSASENGSENENESLFLIVPITVHANGKKINTFAFLDYGSTYTLIEADFVKQMQLHGTPEPFTMVCARREVIHVPESVRFSFSISGENMSKTYRINDVRSVPGLGLPVSSMDPSSLKRKYDYLRGLPLPCFDNAVPTILIGVNNATLLTYNRLVEMENLESSPIAVRTKLGWSVFGQTNGSTSYVGMKLKLSESEEHPSDSELHELVKGYFTTENFGIKPLTDSVQSATNRRVQQLLKETLRKIEDNRYEVGLLWKNPQTEFPNSYGMALKRLMFVESRMKKDEELATWYKNQISDYVSKGFCRKLSDKESNEVNGRTWYIPFFHVINENKVPRKIRLVFDAAARVGNKSLNSELLPGPNVYASLPGMIFKCREGPVCVAADIKEMFPQIKIRKEDQCAQRFLWRDGDSSKRPDVYVMSSMTFGATCSPFLAHTVKNMNAETFKNSYPEAVDAIINRHFVDDYLDSHDSVQDAVRISRQIIEIHSHAGFQLRNFVSNSNEFVNAMSTASKSNDSTLEFNDHTVIEKVLGIFWNINDDCFEVRLNLNKIPPDLISHERIPTKRELLRIVMSIFDPVGLLSHALVCPKVLIQDTWRSRIGWDETLTPTLAEKWKSWFKKFLELVKIKIPRMYSPDIKANKIQLHVFVDASEVAFAAVIYFRIQYSNGVKIVLVTSKAKVAPNKVLTIPRLELQSALLGARLAEFVRMEHRLQFESKFFWSDSKTVLAWILASDIRNLKAFVAVRVSEILELTNASEWRKVPTKLNVADDATKWSDQTTYNCDSRWFHGPDFLKSPENEWPGFDFKDLPKPLEARAPVYQIDRFKADMSVLPINNYSRYSKLLRVVGYVVKSIQYWKKLINKSTVTSVRQLSSDKRIFLSAADLMNAENLILRRAQLDAFPVEYVTLLNGGQINKSSNLFALTPIMCEDSVIRLNSRIKEAPGIDATTKMPAILPNKGAIVDMIIQHHHERFAHQFQEAVVASLRKRFWIIHARSAVRRIKFNCQVCKNERAKPNPTIMGSLPICRLDWKTKPFHHTGMDFFGPQNATIFRKTLKCYVMLFTCMVTRAIHVELVMSLSADDCILNLRNFLNRRGPVAHVYCDNGTNFHGAHNELKREFQARKTELANVNENFYIQWHFNPPSASHFGGAYERMILSVQRALSAILKEQSPRVETLRSALIECENIINSRPLTHVPIDAEDAEPLTPNHFLKYHANNQPAPGIFGNECNLRKQWRISQQLADSFWKKWREFYLPELTRRSKWHQQAPELQEGDVALVVDNSLPRNEWRKAIVEKVLPGSDGVGRVAIVRCGGKSYTRPIMKLAKLDVTKSRQQNV